MPIGEGVGKFFLEILWELILHSFFYGTGWLVIKVFTLGRGRCGDSVTTLIGIATWIAVLIAFLVFQ